MNNAKSIGVAIAPSQNHPSKIRLDLEIVANFIKEKSKVLDIGCGNGELLKHLKDTKKIDGRGLEILQSDVSEAVAKGISVINGDAESDLAYYPDNSFDYAILSQTLQAMHNPQEIIKQMLRIAKFAVISFPNFAHYKNRLYFGLMGKMPVSKTIPYQWYDTPNIHFCSIKDFKELCAKMGFIIKDRVYLTNSRKLDNFIGNRVFANFFAEYGVFLITKKEITLATQEQMVFASTNKPFVSKPGIALAQEINPSCQ